MRSSGAGVIQICWIAPGPVISASVNVDLALIGTDGDERISAEDLASWAGTINYEITCDIAQERAGRRFLGEYSS